MSGPALWQVTSHQAIHETAWHEIHTAWAMAEKLFDQHDYERLAEVAEVFLEIAEVRVLVHAQEEETGLYRQWQDLRPDDGVSIRTLTGQHHKLRQLATELEQAMVNGRHEIALHFMRDFSAELWRHSTQEEELLAELIDAKGRISP